MEKQGHNPLRPDRPVQTAMDASDPHLAIWLFALPTPISTNALWRPVVKQTKTGRVYPDLVLSPKYEAWREEAGRMLMAQPRPKDPLEGAIHVAVRVSPRRRDLDNYLKSVMDALEDARIVQNDMLVADLSIRRRAKHDPDVIWVDVYVSDILR